MRWSVADLFFYKSIFLNSSVCVLALVVIRLDQWPKMMNSITRVMKIHIGP